MEILYNILSAFLISFFAANIAAGPVTFLVFHNSLFGKYKKAVSLIFGSAIMEIIYCSIAIIFVGAVLSHSTRIQIFSQIVSIIMFFIIGLYLYNSNSSKRLNVGVEGLSIKEGTRAFLTGFILTAINPTIILTWSAAAAALLSFNIIEITNMFDVILFSFSVGAGAVSGSLVMIFIVHHFRIRLSENIIKIILKVGGIILIGFSGYFLYDFINLFVI